MEVCVLGSGSAGNCLYVAGNGTRLLVDAGLGLRETVARLAGLGVAPDAMTAVLFTHEHIDHCRGAAALRRRHKATFYANEGTIAGVELAAPRLQCGWQVFETGSPFVVGDLAVEPFSVPHDASDTVGFTIDDGRTRLGIATDLGTVTALVRRKLSGCDALIVETNHDVEMLKHSGRPWSVIQRILGRLGHLSNEDAAALLADVLGPRLKTVFLAHLSAACNTPVLAERAVREALHRACREDVRLISTSPDVPTLRLEL